MSRTEQDQLLTALAALPPPPQDPITRQRTLNRALRALSGAQSDSLPPRGRANADAEPGTAPRGREMRDRRTRGLVGRWLARERALPAVLCLAGALYLRGALLQLVVIFAPERTASSRTIATNVSSDLDGRLTP